MLLEFLGRKASVLLVLVGVLFLAALVVPDALATLAAVLPALYVAFVGAHSYQQVKKPPAPPADPEILVTE
jgi:hypothetical protein